MTVEEIKTALKDICNDCADYIVDLNLDVFPCIMSENKHQIGDYFVSDGYLYFGESSGNPDYVKVGSIDKLQSIYYRLCIESELVDFVFDFIKYRIVREHESFMGQDNISVYSYAKGNWFLENKKISDAYIIEETIEAIVNEKKLP